jgi:hypothetical protein
MLRDENIKDLKSIINKKITEHIEKYNFNVFSLRKGIRDILEKKEISYNTITGMNFLEKLLTRLLTDLEQSYKALTTDASQRQSWKEHILSGIKKIIEMSDANFYASTNASQSAGITEALNNIEIKLNDEKFDENGVLKGEEKEQLSDKDKKKEEFRIPGLEETGAEEAIELLSAKENEILKYYNKLKNKLDRTIFKDRLPKNIEAWIQKWEEDIQSQLQSVNV